MLVDVFYNQETPTSVNVQLDTPEKTVNKKMFAMLKILAFVVRAAMIRPVMKVLDVFVPLDILELVVKG
jgi:hypothetical protein